MKTTFLLIAFLSILFMVACDFQPVEPEVVQAVELNKTAPMPFQYLQEFVPVMAEYNFWVSNDTVFVKFTSGSLPRMTNYFLLVKHTNYSVFYYLHSVSLLTAIPYIGTNDIENVKLYAIVQ